jgi:hypothetical protein
MSSFYVRSDFFNTDSASVNPLASVFSDNQYLISESEAFNSPTYIKGVARNYIDNILLGANSDSFWSDSLGLGGNGAALDIGDIYLPASYKFAQSKCVSDNGGSGTAGGAGVAANVQLNTGNFIEKRSIGNLNSQNIGEEVMYEVYIYSYSAIVINKAYHKLLPSGDGSSATMLSLNMLDSDIDKVPVNTIYINYSSCKILNFKIVPSQEQGSFYYKNLILIEDKTLDYLENFSNKFYYDAGTQRYYLDDQLTECSIKVSDYFYPFVLLVTSDGWVSKSVFHGSISLQLEKINDTTVENISTEINYEYVNICDSSVSVAPNNTISCTSNAGEVSVNVNGVIKIFEDQQICPINGTAKTVIAVFSLKANEILTLYKNFASINTVKADIWGYNFRYIKYFDGTNYYSFKDNGSVASATVSYIDQILDLSKYFSIKEISGGELLSDSGTVVAITLRFRIYKVLETDADGTDYSLDVPVEVKIPRIVSIDEDTEAKQIIIKTDFATRLVYRFNQENDTSINVTDSADGTNQITTISSTGKIGTFFCKAFNFYYDFANIIRNQYATEEQSIELIRNITIPSFTLTVKIGGVAKTIYDENSNSYSFLTFTDLSQDQMLNYTVYSDYITEGGSYTFQLAYSLVNTKYSSMFLRLGNDPTLRPMVLNAGVSSVIISKSNLFKLLDKENRIILSFLADGEVPFDFPFTFLNTSASNPPVCNAFSLSRVQLDYPNASISFPLTYTYADEVEYSIIDQNDQQLYGPILIKEKFDDIEYYFTSGLPRQRSVQINNIKINNQVTSLRARATVRNIISAANPSKAESTQTSSNSYSVPSKIGEAEVALYSDDQLSTEIFEITKGEFFWAFLRLKDINGNVISVGSYSSYLNSNYKPEILLLESADSNRDLDGVISERVNEYIFKFKIENSTLFNDTDAVFQAKYQPIIDSEIQ